MSLTYTINDLKALTAYLARDMLGGSLFGRVNDVILASLPSEYRAECRYNTNDLKGPIDIALNRIHCGRDIFRDGLSIVHELGHGSANGKGSQGHDTVWIADMKSCGIKADKGGHCEVIRGGAFDVAMRNWINWRFKVDASNIQTETPFVGASSETSSASSDGVSADWALFSKIAAFLVLCICVTVLVAGFSGGKHGRHSSSYDDDDWGYSRSGYRDAGYSRWGDE